MMEEINVLSESIIKIESVKEEPVNWNDDYCWNDYEGDNLCPLKREMKMEDDEEITIALSGVVFLLLVEGHNWAPRGSPRYLFVTLVCGKTAIEILDTGADRRKLIPTK
ncbi:hypothetical protein R5R35_000771 [Gryllus longicercus]|uniref:Uncharacterized protein n=1 Tax=Gryllus longicercus TaxID=2509291 RepID=A0AAN9VH70_9ORTH